MQSKECDRKYIRAYISSNFLRYSDSKFINKDIRTNLLKAKLPKLRFKMRFSLTTIAIALLGSAMALPSSDVNHVEERAAQCGGEFDYCASDADCCSGYACYTKGSVCVE
ncbi:hypothetical protein N8I77_002906 [Diaporthe amygdali]|uniref:Uncharacterized protein n=1 Tax=Phomopsis amygdali TaxID=1214568 RepID=A0AAD9SIV2_PHOAM|nr:hypothetical protein N8I77_002906 [Diaporthe amygdali]